MKKSLFFAALAGLVLASCKQELAPGTNPSSQEISLSAAGSGTKAEYGDGTYVQGSLFAGSLYNALHPTSDPDIVNDARTMWISSYLTPQTGIPGTYFEAYTYKYDSTGDNLWHNFVGDTKTPIYWPLGGKLDFMALSASGAGFPDDLAFNKVNVSQKATVSPSDNAYKQDDILFCSVANRTIGTEPTVEMEFHHAQAWLQFRLTGTKENVIKIKSIQIEDAYDYEKSEFNVVNNNGNALGSWDFRKCVRKNVLMDDINGVYDQYLPVKDAAQSWDGYAYLDMLIPEQPKTSFLITYTLEGQPNLLQYRYELAHENWLMNYRYVYSIDFDVNEITVDAKVETFHGGNVSDLQ